MKIFISKVKGFKGECSPTWLNKNQVFNRLDGGVSGFFKLTKKLWIFKYKYGKEFHGLIKYNTNIVISTEGIMNL